jgi:hypothetical protein
MTIHENVVESILYFVRDKIEAVPEDKGEVLCMSAAALVGLAKSMCDPREWEELEAGIFESADVISRTIGRVFP